MADLVKAKLELWVYGGNINNVPVTPDYTLQKTKLTTEDIIIFEVSELIKDFVEIEFNGDYNTLVQSKWVYWVVTRTYSDDSTDTFSERAIAFRGYGDNEDGINPELSKDLLISNKVIHNLCGSSLTIPFYTRDDGSVSVTYAEGVSDTGTLVTGSSSLFTIAQEVKLNPLALSVITIDKTADTTTNSQDSVDISDVPENTDKIKYISGGIEKIIEIKCIEDCKNIPYKISFINKFGVMQDMWFFAKRKDSISSTRESYESTKLEIKSTGASYNASKHSNSYLKNQGKESLIMNTGFIDESYNEVIKELMVSEYVYIHDSRFRSPTNVTSDLAVPVTLESNSLELKTRANDKLINYELSFSADSDFIQSVR